MKTALIPVLLVLVCMQSPVARGADDITNDMSRAGVIGLMGQPRGAMTKGTDEVLLFANGTVTLRGGKVIASSLLSPRPREAPPPPVQEQPPRDATARRTSPPAGPNRAKTSLQAEPTNEAGAVAWQTDFAKASAAAAQAHRYLLLDFTGSDWCGFCMKLEKEVFSTAEFASFVADRFVCVRVDFPRKQAQPDDLKKQNAELAKNYPIHGYPTVVILAPDGKLVGSQSGYRGNGQQVYIEQLKTMMAEYEKRSKL